LLYAGCPKSITNCSPQRKCRGEFITGCEFTCEIAVFDTTNRDIKAILFDYPDIDLVQFYTNAINTRTHGFNRSDIFGEIKTTDKISDTARYTSTLFGKEEKTTLEKGQPGEKIILFATITKGKFGFAVRNTHFGNTALVTIDTNPTDTLYESFSSKILTDISITYTPRSWLAITAGANNIFDVYPDRLKNYRNTGEGSDIYSNGASPFGYNGGYYFVGVSFNF